MLNDFRVILTIIFTRLLDFIRYNLAIYGLSAVLSPLGFVVGFGLLLYLINAYDWYLDVWLLSFILSAVLYLVSRTYRRLTLLVFQALHSLTSEKYHDY